MSSNLMRICFMIDQPTNLQQKPVCSKSFVASITQESSLRTVLWQLCKRAWRHLSLSMLSLPFLLSPAAAMAGKALILEKISTSQPVSELLQQAHDDGTRGSYIRQGRDWYRISPCKSGDSSFCLTKSKPKAAPSLPSSEDNALGDGRVALSPTGDIRAAWLTKPTKRYAHGVLGDAIEAGGVAVQTKDGGYRHFSLPKDSVFEDLEPRLADLDGDGRIELVLVRSYLDAGAAISILGLREDQLSLLTESPAIGTANRWLNPSFLGDLTGSGQIEIGLVRTPHIGGQLQIWQFDGKRLRQRGKANGFSNHSIGSRALGLSSILRSGSKRRLILPDARQSALLVLDGKSLTPLARISLPARPIGDFLHVENSKSQQTILLGLADGHLYALSNPDGTLFD